MTEYTALEERGKAASKKQQCSLLVCHHARLFMQTVCHICCCRGIDHKTGGYGGGVVVVFLPFQLVFRFL